MHASTKQVHSDKVPFDLDRKKKKKKREALNVSIGIKRGAGFRKMLKL